MKHMLRLALPVFVVMAAFLAITSSATAVTITPNGTTATANLDSGTQAVFTFGGMTITCTNHTIKAVINGTATAVIKNTANTYTTGGGQCPYTGLGGGTARITVDNAWTLTATSTTAGTITAPNGSWTTNLTGFLGFTCNLTVAAFTVLVSWTEASTQLATSGANSVQTLGCIMTATATQQETLTVLPTTVSVT